MVQVKGNQPTLLGRCKKAAAATPLGSTYSREQGRNRFERRTVTKTLADLIEDQLPQTQCTKCGYPACRPYAEAIARGEAEINQCPPGGIEGVRIDVEAGPEAYAPLMERLDAVL